MYCGTEVHEDDFSAIDLPSGDCRVDVTVVCPLPSAEESVEDVTVDDSLEVKFKTFCAAWRG